MCPTLVETPWAHGKMRQTLVETPVWGAVVDEEWFHHLTGQAVQKWCVSGWRTLEERMACVVGYEDAQEDCS
jgi:hypothetical protein